MGKVDITVIIPSKNEEKNIAACLMPLQNWAAKIIVVDSNSKDKTVEIAQSYGAEVVSFNYQGGWPKKRQYILEKYKFTTSWILLLDSDEILTEATKAEIENSILKTEYDGYYLFFRMEFLGKMLKYSSSDLRKLSLFRTGKGEFEKRFEDQDSSMGDMEVHEHVIVKGKVGVIKNPIIHRNINNLSRFIIKHDEYSNYECHVHTEGLATDIKEKFFGTKEERRRYIKKRFIRNPVSPFFYFLHLYLFKGGFLDGRAGFYYIIYQCMYLYFVSSKIYEIELKSYIPLHEKHI
jgi:glycosyltransferase involved in cell wall biosynthesis